MEFENISFNVTNDIATVKISRPKALNALNKATLEELLDCFTLIADNPTIHVVILTGEGEKAFVAGADISYMKPLTPAEAKTFGKLGHLVMQTIEKLPQPVIAAVNGFALGGGCELAISCDIRLASDNAKFGQPEVNLGIIPGFGGTQRLPRLVGKGIANELILSGKMIDAEEACRIGLVNRVVSQDKLMDECTDLAKMIASRGPTAVRFSKEAVNNGIEMDITRACSYEADLFALCFASGEQEEGIGAFLEKRAPEFKE
jgi:enoyl-CoA hydratase